MAETPNITPSVTLDRGERAVARLIADARYTNNRSSGVENQRIGPQSDEETDLSGIGAELAFCKLTNVYPDLTVEPRGGGWDCLSQKFSRIDVKTTTYPNGKLLARRTKTVNDADIYVLMVGEFPTYRWVGWVLSNELIKDENLIDLGHGPTYALDQHRLRPPAVSMLNPTLVKQAHRLRERLDRQQDAV